MIDDQHSQHTENRNRQRDDEGPRERSLRLDSFLRLMRSHGCPSVFLLVKIKSRPRRMFHGTPAGFRGTNCLAPHFPSRGRYPPFKTAPVADSQRSLTRCSNQARARIAKGGGLVFL